MPVGYKPTEIFAITELEDVEITETELLPSSVT